MAVPAFQRLVLRAIAVLLVHKSARDRAGTGVHILVSTPASEINIPVVQFQLDIAGRVREVPADEDAAGVGVGGDGGDVEELAAVVLDSGEEDQGQLVGVLVDEGGDALG